MSLLRRRKRTSGNTYLPIELVNRLQLGDVERAALPNKLYITRACRAIVEGNEHHIRQVHARQLDVQDSCRSLDLCLKTM